MALGAVEAETLVALGIAPVSRPGSDSSPWYRSAVRSIVTSEELQNYDDAKSLSSSLFSDIKPDAFISVGPRLGKAEYESLSKLAPVLLAPENVSPQSWEDIASFVASAVGMTKPMESLVADAKTAIAEIVEDYPDLQGASTLMVSASSVSGSDYVLSGTHSSPMAFLKGIGMKEAPAVATLAAKLTAANARFPYDSLYLPRTQSGRLSADVLIVSVPAVDYTSYKANEKLGEGFPAFGDGTLYVTNAAEALSLQRQSILGAQWCARNVLPELAKSVYLNRQK
ncbi:ABC transporter substrate-binding protein [Pseudarthrobacter sp. J1763]|uniref:ABC transporter substrate-binding protein n=1 Tax=Pseudarthrobacter sp. J1763 TaxID=3420445 RepID=UPI003D26C03B